MYAIRSYYGDRPAARAEALIELVADELRLAPEDLLRAVAGDGQQVQFDA